MMAPSAKIQSRIHAFEALGSNCPPSTSNSTSQGQNLLEEPISPTAKSFSLIKPSAPNPSLTPSPSPSPPNLGRKTSLIDLRDWVVDDGPTKSTSGTNNSHHNTRRPPLPRRAGPPDHAASTPLISLQPPIQTRTAPPIPPKMRTNGEASLNGGLPVPKRSDSLTVEHTYPPFLTLDTSNPRKGLGHAQASSVSSFHSVSLSDNESVAPSSANFVSTHSADLDGDADSLDESFENVSALSSPMTFVSHDLGSYDNTLIPTTPLPPKLPERPRPRPTPSPAHSPSSSPKRYNGVTGGSSRRLPPPPPRPGNSRPSSARSSVTSVLSATTSRASTSLSTQSHPQLKLLSQLTRPTPIPAAAKHRYETVFFANVRVRRKAENTVATPNSNFLAPNSVASATTGRQVRKAAGWRGLSVDLTTNPEETLLHVNDMENGSRESLDSGEQADMMGPDERLDGHTVRQIWSASKLERTKLRDIWNDCDSDRSGSLDVDGFVRGMWRIDEELRRARLGPQSAQFQGPSRRQPRRSNSSLVPR